MIATFYDGVTASRRSADVLVESDRLVLRWGEDQAEEVASADLVRLDGPANSLRLGRKDRPGWRLVFAADDADVLAPILPAEARYGRWVDRLGLWRAAAAFGAVAAVVLLVGHVAPEWIAPHVPQRWENQLGASLVGDFGSNRCKNVGTDAALARLGERIAPGIGAPGDRHVQLTTIDLSLFNAAALPGAQIIVFRGLLDTARNGDADAGVLAHEIAHVRRRHVTQALIREFGIGSIVRLFAGGIGANTEQLVSLSYTRANEAQADADAIAMLRAARIDPRPTARLFEQLANRTGERADSGRGYGQYLESHPVSRDRAKLFAASYDPRIAYTPAVSAADGALLLGCNAG